MNRLALSALLLIGCGDDRQPDSPDAAIDACVPRTCEQLGVTCDRVDDGCGHDLACGTCAAPSTCGGQGTANVCAIPLADRACVGPWCFETPAPIPAATASLFERTSSDVWSANARGIVQHYDGVRWTLVATPVHADLHDVWMTPAGDDGWIAGDNGTVLRWRNHAWTAVATPTSTRAPIRGVWGSSATDVWLVGDGVVLHWNGATLADVASGSHAFDDVYVTPAGAVFATAEGRAWLLDGGTWIAQTPDSSFLNVVWMTSLAGTGTRVCALGSAGVFSGSFGRAYCTDGGDWYMPEPPPEQAVDLFFGAFAVGADVYGVSLSGLVNLSTFAVTAPPTGEQLAAASPHVIATKSGGVWSGDAANASGGGWARFGGDEPIVMDTIGTVGPGETIWFSSWRGVTEWRGGFVPYALEVRSTGPIGGTSRTDVFAIRGSDAATFDGVHWTEVTFGAPVHDARALYSAGDEVVVAGDVIVHRDSAGHWMEDSVDAPSVFRWTAIAEHAHDLWLAGVDYDGRALVARRTAGVWSSVAAPSDLASPCGIAVIAANDVWLAGFDGGAVPNAGLSHWNGTTWSTTIDPVARSLCAITAAGDDLYVSGMPGDVRHRDASGTWTLEPAVTVGFVWALRATETDIWAIADHGAVLRRAR